MRSGKTLLALVLCGSPAAAADVPQQPKVVGDLAQCRTIQEDAARLKCFDATAAALLDAAESRSIVVLDKTEVRRTRRSLFGFPLPNLPFLGQDADDDKDDGKVDAGLKELSTTVVGVAPTGYGLWSITLAEGGTWRTTDQDRSFEPRAGMAITVKRGLIGNYLATVGGRRGIRLQRVK